ncbi:hypothetical protein HMPREF3038_01166 [Akkermansia sp. KLE1797]|nr:hypothetical protein HMPREF3038_01166 [Akkermansia sp. KLE1797]KXU53316.1 hypothetical protein HMPREF3039_02498 [Akkermansia sp. KLE1798]KZA05148.1 hypothetical protein HMPREF1326_01184 [Akkermansia sp. KLE1605]
MLSGKGNWTIFFNMVLPTDFISSRNRGWTGCCLRLAFAGLLSFLLYLAVLLIVLWYYFSLECGVFTMPG